MATVPFSVETEDAPGQLLRELERRQDDVLAQLDLLNEQVEAVLESLGVRFDEPAGGQGASEAEVIGEEAGDAEVAA